MRYSIVMLRSYSYKARAIHLCDNCCHYIEPGDRYYAQVWAIDRRVTVIKIHEHCPVNPLQEEEEYLEMAEGKEDETLSDAA